MQLTRFDHKYTSSTSPLRAGDILACTSLASQINYLCRCTNTHDRIPSRTQTTSNGRGRSGTTSTSSSFFNNCDCDGERNRFLRDNAGPFVAARAHRHTHWCVEDTGFLKILAKQSVHLSDRRKEVLFVQLEDGCWTIAVGGKKNHTTKKHCECKEKKKEAKRTCKAPSSRPSRARKTASHVSAYP